MFSECAPCLSGVYVGRLMLYFQALNYVLQATRCSGLKAWAAMRGGEARESFMEKVGHTGEP